MSRNPAPCRDANCRHGDCALFRQTKQLDQRLGEEYLRASKAESKCEVLKAELANLEAAMRGHEKEKSEMKEKITFLEASLKEKDAAVEVEKELAAELQDTMRMVNFNKEHQLVMAQQALALVNKVQLDKAETLSDIIQTYLHRLDKDIDLHAHSSYKPASSVLRTPKRPHSPDPTDDSAKKQATRPRVPAPREKANQGVINGTPKPAITSQSPSSTRL